MHGGPPVQPAAADPLPVPPATADPPARRPCRHRHHPGRRRPAPSTARSRCRRHLAGPSRPAARCRRQPGTSDRRPPARAGPAGRAAAASGTARAPPCRQRSAMPVPGTPWAQPPQRPPSPPADPQPDARRPPPSHASGAGTGTARRQPTVGTAPPPAPPPRHAARPPPAAPARTPVRRRPRPASGRTRHTVPRRVAAPGVVEVPHHRRRRPDAVAAAATRSSAPMDAGRRRADRRGVRPPPGRCAPPEPVATMGVRAVLNAGLRWAWSGSRPASTSRSCRQDVEMVRRNFGGLRQVTVVNPKGGAGKTVRGAAARDDVRAEARRLRAGLGQQRDPGHPRHAGAAGLPLPHGPRPAARPGPVPRRARPGRRPVAVRARAGRGHVRRARLRRVGHRRRDAHRRRVRARSARWSAGSTS